LAHYFIYGYKVNVSLDLRLDGSGTSEPPDISIVIERPTNSSIKKPKRAGKRSFSIRQTSDSDVISSNDGLKLQIFDDRIICTADPRVFDDNFLRIELLGTAMPLWLERKGTVTFHCAAVETCGNAFVLLADSGEGKSTMAAHLLKKDCRLLADDVTAVEVESGTPMIQPAFPQMKLWPGSVKHLKKREKAYPRVIKGFPKRLVPVGGEDVGGFCNRPTPLKAIYLLKQGTAREETRIEEKSQSQCLVELLCYSFVGKLLEGSSGRPERLKRLGDVARCVPLKELTYPTGFDKIHEVCDRILDDFHG
jgi:hypothetical protein